MISSSEQMSGKLRRARKRQRKLLKRVAKDARKSRRITNRSYRKNTRVEQGNDFVGGGGLDNLIGGVLDIGGDVVSAYTGGGAAGAAGGGGMPFGGGGGGAPQAVQPQAAGMPGWVLPVGLGAGALVLVMVLKD